MADPASNNSTSNPSSASNASSNTAPDSPAAMAALTREQLVARIRNSSKDAVILAEMQRLGFWSAEQPTVAESLIKREAELSQQLQALNQQLYKIRDPVEALKAMRKERMAKARERREETKQKLAARRLQRALDWHARKGQDIGYLGEEVSQGLSHTEVDVQRMAQYGVPQLATPLATPLELAQAMGIALPELRFLAFHRRVSRISHYRRFAIAKKTGGERIISAPMPRLKRAQYWVLDNLLAKAAIHPAAHGFVAGRSIVSNAAPHVGQAVVINLDLKDFFPSIGLPRIKGVFRTLGLSEQVATVLALLCTEAPTEQVSVDGENFFVATGQRVLPQGAPTSPALTNILCRRLDARLQACAAKLGFQYTRYADDLTFSGDPAAAKLAGKLLWRAKQIVIDEGFTPHPQKQQVMRASQHQEVTGIVVNKRPTVQRETLKRFRATLFQVEKDGPEGKHWHGNPNVLAALVGYAQFVRMVDADKGGPLLLRARAARARWSNSEPDNRSDASPVIASGVARRNSDFRLLAAQGKAPWPDWWQPALPAAPVLEKTQQQLTDEKTQAKTRQKQAQQAEASGAPGAAPARPGKPPTPTFTAPATGKSNHVPWLDWILQLGLGLVLALVSRQPALMIVAVIMVWRAGRTGRANWMGYVLAMLAVFTLLSVFK